MFKQGRTVCPARRHPATVLPTRGTGFYGFILTLLLAVVLSARAEGPDEQYLGIYKVIEQADALNQAGQADSAKAKYREAQAGLLKLKEGHPTWNAKIISYRLNYVVGKIAALAQPVAAAGDTTTARPAAASTAGKSAVAAGQVKLLDAGAEPRQVLRLHATPGNKQAMAMTMKMGMDMGLGEAGGQAMKLPAFAMSLAATVESVSPEGDIAYEMILEDIGLAEDTNTPPQMAELLKQSLAGVKGVTSKGVISNRGVSKSAEVSVPAGADPQTQQTMEQMKEAMSSMTIALPEEAVGPGAKWEVKQVIQQQGMTIAQTTTRELLSLNGNVLKIKSTITQQAGKQKMQNPSLPGMKADLTKLTGEGTGEGEFDLTKLLTVQATAQMHTEMAMGMNVAGQQQTMTMKMDMDIRLESKESK